MAVRPDPPIEPDQLTDTELVDRHFEDCWYCTGELCAVCLSPSIGNPCEHDFSERHGDELCFWVYPRGTKARAAAEEALRLRRAAQADAGERKP